jgi:hypothetical protein
MNNSRGILLFAYNTAEVDYLKAAEITADRARRFLNLPATVVTDEKSVAATRANTSAFDKVITTQTADNNYLNRKLWLNKGRHQAYELSPYDDTILLDVDYVINSKHLLSLFEFDHDIQIHDTSITLMTSNEQEQIGTSKFNTLWATLIRFKKTIRARQLFEMLKMVQENYNFYTHLYHFQDYIFRNDYAVTIALKTINGQLFMPEDFIRSPLVHVPDYIRVTQSADTEFTLERKDPVSRRYECIRVRDFDFHMMHKNNFFEIFDEQPTT